MKLHQMPTQADVLGEAFVAEITSEALAVVTLVHVVGPQVIGSFVILAAPVTGVDEAVVWKNKRRCG